MPPDFFRYRRPLSLLLLSLLSARSPFDTYKYEANNTCVHHYEEMSCVINSHGGNFYHDLMETMPALLLLKPFLELRPGMPIAFSELQVGGVGMLLECLFMTRLLFIERIFIEVIFILFSV